jgi:uncharacterized protein YodC (DUF2158 family)
MKIGTVVTLKAGSHKMTVVEVTAEFVMCGWFTMNLKYETQYFPLDALVEVSETNN